METYKTMGYEKYLTEREERATRALAEYAAQERELKRMQEFVDRMGAKASKATQAQDRMKKIAKLEESMKLPAFVEAEQRAANVKLTLAKPPSCGEWPVKLQGASFGYGSEEGEDAVPIINNADVVLERGMRLIVRGPNGAGKSTLLKAISGDLPLISGERIEDERLSLGLFAQDLAQELPQDMRGVDFVTQEVRQYDSQITDTLARKIMGSLGLRGEKATRLIGMLSGGEKARVALATFCLTPHNVLLLDEPTNHLDVEAIAALLDALADYEGAIVVVSHDRPFCEAISCTHVAYAANGAVTVEERNLQESDWTEDVGRSVGRSTDEEAA